VRRIFELVLLVLARIVPRLYDTYFWTRPRYRQALDAALAANADAYHACDWAMLPIAVQAAAIHGVPVSLDADEFWPSVGSSRLWIFFFAPLVRYILCKYSSNVVLTTTVSQPFVERYKQEFGLDCHIIFNAPPLPDSFTDFPRDGKDIRVIHQGYAIPNRHLERIIDAIALADPRFKLDLLLIYTERHVRYVEQLKARAESVAKGRVVFRPPVLPEAVVQSIADCDIGLAYMAPTTVTNQMTLPNKVIESIVAGLAVLVGPSPAMAQIVQDYGVGWVASGFTADELAATLNAITYEDLEQRKAASRVARKQLNAQIEQAKFLALFNTMLNGKA
jgi:glycosyltransferase involved in cell wall biosynthesis